jgi:AraC-like DNA-binding protein
MSADDSYPKQYLYRRVVRAKLFIDAHFSAAIDLNNIADEACFSKFHFTRLFKKIYGKTPHQYLTDVRINAGKELLAANEPVASVCFSVGFDSISSFTGLFHRRVGVTPAAFQRDSLLRKHETSVRPLKFVPNCFVDSIV